MIRGRRRGRFIESTLLFAKIFKGEILLVIGNTKDEASLFLVGDDRVWNGTLTEDELKTYVARIAGADTDRVLKPYRSRVRPGDTGL
jgi:hypothetical protein